MPSRQQSVEARKFNSQCWLRRSLPPSYFFPVVFLYGVSRYMFIALALGVVLALAASYLVAMTVVPLFCARFIKTAHGHGGHHTKSFFGRLVTAFNRKYDQLLMHYDRAVEKALARPGKTILVIMGSFVVSLALYPLLGLAFFPRTDPGQFVINVKAPTGSRLEVTNQYVARIENDIRDVISGDDLQMIVSNIGVTPDLSSIYTSNSGQHTAFVQVSLKSEHKLSTFSYMDRVRQKLASDLPEVSTYFQTGGLVESVVNQGMPAPIDIQVSGKNQAVGLRGRKSTGGKAALDARRQRRTDTARSRLSGPGIECSSRNGGASRAHCSDVVNNVITALTSNGMIAPSYWVDPHSGNNYLLTVQYGNRQIDSMTHGRLQADSLACSQQRESHDVGKRGRH